MTRPNHSLSLSLFLFLFLFLFLPLSSSAYLMYSNSRIDRALYDGHDPKVVVFAKIIKKYDRPKRDPNEIYFFDGPDTREIDIQVLDVIMGDTNLRTKTIHLDVSSFDWPDSLVKEDLNHSLIFILYHYKNEENPYQISVVVPSVSSSFAYAKRNREAKIILEQELIKVIKQTKSVAQRRESILQIAPILHEHNAEGIFLYLNDKDTWVRRAALGAWVYATESNLSLKTAAEDIQNFLSTTHKDSLIKNIDPGLHYAPYPLYQKYMLFLQSYCMKDKGVWSQEEKDKDCRIMQKIIALNILDKKVLKIIKDDF